MRIFLAFLFLQQESSVISGGCNPPSLNRGNEGAITSYDNVCARATALKQVIADKEKTKKRDGLRRKVAIAALKKQCIYIKTHDFKLPVENEGT